ncbi:MAG: hypothetical protein FJW27_18465 [Acidimicrobiia bacterium]|nr:hypothetical protein [Acidimicrobiia bacterium]
MSRPWLKLASALAGAVSVAVLLTMPQHATLSAQSGREATASASAPKTPWGEPSLEGIWTVERLVPLERPAGVTAPFYTDEQVAKLDEERSGKSVFGNHVREKRGSEADVSGAYNAEFTSQRRTGKRTAMIIDPPDGKVPALTPEAQARQAALREYQAALIQATDACKSGLPGCKYGPPSPRLLEPPTMYPVVAINRAYGPEDRGLGERCMGGGLPDFRGGFTGNHRQIVQSRGAVTIFYDTGQGQGFMRTIPVTDRPHLPATVRQWWGDSRARWDGDTLVVDVTNFSTKTELQGSRENLHLVERWRRSGPTSLEVTVLVEDPTTWTKPWTAIQEFELQPARENRIYMEPRCHEGNHGLPGILAGARTQEAAYDQKRGPHPASYCLAACAGPDAEDRDPLALR